MAADDPAGAPGRHSSRAVGDSPVLQSAPRPGGATVAHDVFISYSSKDKTIADAVCARLESRGIRCWIAPRDVHPGSPYGEEIIDGIHNCRLMVLVLSANANVSTHIPKEIERAVSHGIPVIPLRVEEVTPAKSLDYFISSVHWLDAITPPLEQHVDNLANTILAVLAQRGGAPATPPAIVAPKPSAVVAPIAATSTPAPVMPPKSNRNLLLAIGGAIVLAAFGAWFFVGREAGGDPITGCWQWYNNAQVRIFPNGKMTAGPFTASWRLVDSTQRIYNLTWPQAVDNAQLSGDGRTLHTSNQYGISLVATRITYGPGIVGSWRWPNGAIILVRPDGGFNTGPLAGHWRLTGNRTFALTWPNPVDTVTLSADHQSLNGGNQFGFSTSGTKSSSCSGN